MKKLVTVLCVFVMMFAAVAQGSETNRITSITDPRLKNLTDEMAQVVKEKLDAGITVYYTKSAKSDPFRSIASPMLNSNYILLPDMATVVEWYLQQGEEDYTEQWFKATKDCTMVINYNSVEEEGYNKNFNATIRVYCDEDDENIYTNTQYFTPAMKTLYIPIVSSNRYRIFVKPTSKGSSHLSMVVSGR